MRPGLNKWIGMVLIFIIGYILGNTYPLIAIDKYNNEQDDTSLNEQDTMAFDNSSAVILESL